MVPDLNMPSEPRFKPELVRKYGGRGDGYAFYPPADRFIEAFDAAAYQVLLENRGTGAATKPLALHVHLPFRNIYCHRCACNTGVSGGRGGAAACLDYLGRELRIVAGHMGQDRSVRHMAWSGGALALKDLVTVRQLMQRVRAEFDFDPGGECAIEIDPSATDGEQLGALGDLGFNSASLGVQAFNPRVLRAVERLFDAARRNGLRSVGIDLAYGLPLQTVRAFSTSLDRIIGCAPDRIALYSCPELPGVPGSRRRFSRFDLPLPEERLDMLIIAMERLLGAGYRPVGPDQFARPDDSRCTGAGEGRAARALHDLSMDGNTDVVTLGVAAISSIGSAYSQNARTIKEYCGRLEQHRLPVARGLELAPDDLIRRAVIQGLRVHGEVSMESVGIAYLVDCKRYFTAELAALEPLAADGLVDIDGEWITATAQGRLLISALCRVFDRYCHDPDRAGPRSFRQQWES